MIICWLKWALGGSTGVFCSLYIYTRVIGAEVQLIPDPFIQFSVQLLFLCIPVTHLGDETIDGENVSSNLESVDI